MRRPVLGMVGAGQLARMSHQALIGLDVDLHVFAAKPDDSAATVSGHVTVGSWDSLDDLAAFADDCDVVTFDHELVDPAILHELVARGHVLRPAPEASLYAQDKLHQRRELGALGLPVPAFDHVGGVGDIHRFTDAHGWPIVAKATRGGYDGRGVWILDDVDDAEELWRDATANEIDLLVEELVPIEREVAVSAVRRPAGDIVTYPVTETVQSDGICVELIAPAEITEGQTQSATELAVRIAEAVGLVGHMAVELFVTENGLVLNELALRPHNSMHWTIEGALTSQFDNHARGALDWPLGSTQMTAPYAATVNVLGPADGSDPRARIPDALTVPGVHVHLYGKDARPGRKLGHVTTLGDDRADTRARAHRAADILTGQEQP